MEWKELNKEESNNYYNNELVQGILLGVDDSYYSDLKKNIKIAFDDSLNAVNLTAETLIDATRVYSFDVQFAARIYDLFRYGKYSMNEREASNDGIWRYIQVKIVPDVIIYRWGIDNTARLFNQSNRLYLKTLWWYIHLSYTGNLRETMEMLLNPCNTSDTIAQLTERSGKNGYRIDLYRNIMFMKTKNNMALKEFRKLMVLNSARVKNINPSLSTGGVYGYVEKLISDERNSNNGSGSN